MTGAPKALQLLIGGESISATEAKSIHLVDEVFSADELIAGATAYATRIAEKPQTAVRSIKRLVKQPADSLEAALANERSAQLACFEDPQHREIVEDFLRKRR
jgi:enoyl-CoA hydratase/carnithine racemase